MGQTESVLQFDSDLTSTIREFIRTRLQPAREDAVLKLDTVVDLLQEQNENADREDIVTILVEILGKPAIRFVVNEDNDPEPDLILGKILKPIEADRVDGSTGLQSDA